MRKKHGTWVFRVGQALSTETVRRALDEIREERETRAPAAE